MISVSPKCTKCMQNFWANDQESDTILVPKSGHKALHPTPTVFSIYLNIILGRPCRVGQGQLWWDVNEPRWLHSRQVEDMQSRRLPFLWLWLQDAFKLAALWPVLLTHPSPVSLWVLHKACHFLVLGTALSSSEQLAPLLIINSSFYLLIVLLCLSSIPTITIPNFSNSLQMWIRSHIWALSDHGPKKRGKGSWISFIFFSQGL